MTRNLSEGQHLTGESGSSYLVVSPMFHHKPGAPVPNVWSAVDSGTQEDVFILKQPGGDELADNANAGAAWPRFQSEMIMHELFKENPHIRQQVDRIPPTVGRADEPPRIVLEPTETTLWSARAKRPFTDDEIRVVMRGALLGLRAIHEKNLVYADLKPDNIFVNGFRQTADETTAENSLNAVIGDLGLVMEPSVGKVQPLVYRSPEVHFKSSITPAADIWSWGMIYTHLLQAQLRLDRPGLYDLQDGASAIQAEQAIRRFITDDFDLHNVPYYSDCVLPSGHSRAEPEVWSQRLRKAGVPDYAVSFLEWVLEPDPRKRPEADEILAHEWFGRMDGGAGANDDDAKAPGRKHSLSSFSSSGGIFLPDISTAAPRHQEAEYFPNISSSTSSPTPQAQTHSHSSTSAAPSAVQTPKLGAGAAPAVNHLAALSSHPPEAEMGNDRAASDAPIRIERFVSPPMKRAHESDGDEKKEVGEKREEKKVQGASEKGESGKGGFMNSGLMSLLRGE